MKSLVNYIYLSVNTVDEG